ncbi:ribonuclease P protein component [Patescibacteria group bacterium]|nr:ribonuclease P protein component [Patescibacteria group bacterium]
MLPPKNRLKKTRDFNRIYRYGYKFFSPELILRWVKDNRKECSRWGIIVSRKVDKKAVIRNKIKRRLRAILRENINSWPLQKDIVLIARPQIKELSFSELKKRLEQILRKNKLLSS